MPYSYAPDNDPGVVAGAGGITYGGVIQRPDGYQGYNTVFSPVTRGLGFYHIHFGPGGCAIRVIRYFRSSGEQGSNIVHYNNDKAKNASGLLHDAMIHADYYPNYVRLFGHLKLLIAGLPKNPDKSLV